MNALWDAGAVYRLTRLATADSLLHAPREAVVRWAYRSEGKFPDIEPAQGWTQLAMDDGPDAPKLATLVTCRWCAGFYVAVGVLVARRLFPRAWHPLAKALTYSAGAALLAGLEDP